MKRNRPTAATACTAIAMLAALSASAGARDGFSKNGLHYRDEGNGPPLVLIHAFQMDLREWDDVAPRLIQQRRAVRYDVRGHGTSKVDGALPSQVEDLLGLLDELQIRRATFVGLSMGSTIALNLALAAPDRVDRLILIAPGVPGIEQGTSPQWLRPVMDAARARESIRAAELWWKSPLFDSVRSRGDSAGKYRQVVMDNARIWTLSPAPAPKPPAGTRLNEVVPPVTVIAGDRDELGSLEVARVVATGVPKGTLVVVPGAGHMLSVARPADLARLVLDHSARPAGSGR